jgi:hypothetical protein
MSRSGERQYGDWEASIRAAARPFRRRRIVLVTAEVAISGLLIIAALFGS